MITLIEVDLVDNFLLNPFIRGKLERYTKAVLAGDKFPPISVVLESNGRFTVYDGHHRLAAHKSAGMNRIKAVVTFEGCTSKEIENFKEKYKDHTQ